MFPTFGLAAVPSPRTMRILCLALVLVAGYGHGMEIHGFSPDRVIAYKTVSGKDLNLHVFLPEGHAAGDRRPAIVFFFGGGWTGGSPTQFHPHCDHLASLGMVAMSAEYRVKSRDDATPRECLMDAKSAMRWIRAHAGEFGVDPTRIAAAGGSAGGHLAAATALVHGFDDPADDPRIDPRPNALVLFNPVVDNGPGGYGHDRVGEYWEAFSPLHNVSADTPPTVFFLGTEDNLIPVSVGESFRDRVQAAGGRCDLHLYEGRGHGFFNYPNREVYEETLREMVRFLASLGYLEPGGDPEP